MRHTSYLVKNQHSYCFRQRVPLDLQGIKRINFYIGFASQLFNYAKKNHYIDMNPFEGLKIKEKNRRPDEEQDAFNKNEIEMIFCNSKEYLNNAHKKPSQFWLWMLILKEYKS